MTDIEFKVSDLIYSVRDAEFGIIYCFGIGDNQPPQPIAKIYWQKSQYTEIFSLSMLRDMYNYPSTWTHYPSETK
jgi:hypothetical protein